MHENRRIHGRAGKEIVRDSGCHRAGKSAETHRNGCPKTAAPIVEDVGCYNRAAVIARIPIGLIESCVEPDWAAGGVRKRRSAEAQVGIGGFRFCPIPDLSDLQL